MWGGTHNRKFHSSSLYAFYYWSDLIIAVDVALDTDTPHPRLGISNDGKMVKDTGAIKRVPSKEKSFDSHTFVLAKEGYASGRNYREVDVGKRSWALGIARESVTPKGHWLYPLRMASGSSGLQMGETIGPTQILGPVWVWVRSCKRLGSSWTSQPRSCHFTTSIRKQLRILLPVLMVAARKGNSFPSSQ